MACSDLPDVSFVFATHNRRAAIGRTLAQITRCGLQRHEYEIIVVDNASDDETVREIASRVDHLVRLRRNKGSCAKAWGVDCARGRYIVFLDDDAYPRTTSVRRMIEHFEGDRQLGAAGFTVCLPDGRLEGAALPGVFVGCGVGFRADALRSVGGIDRTFFMQAEEYDLTFRLVTAGWKVQVMNDIYVEHMKTSEARRTDRTTFHDIRNNLRVVARYLPEPYYTAYCSDWLQRYRWLAARNGMERAFNRGARAGRRRSLVERRLYCSRRLGLEAIERFFCWHRIETEMADLARTGINRIVLADLGKNCFPFHRGALLAGVRVSAIADDRFCAPGREYRGIPVLSVDRALQAEHDAVVVSNTAPVHASAAEDALASVTSNPVYNWFGSSTLHGEEAGMVLSTPA
ncbi:MAG: glycosyltransferase family 2 protein [Phycisphaerae bacterium]